MGICKLKKYYDLCKEWDPDDTNKEGEPFINKKLFNEEKYLDRIESLYYDELKDEANAQFIDMLDDDKIQLTTEIFGESTKHKQILSTRLVNTMLDNYIDDVCIAYLRSSMESLEEQVIHSLKISVPNYYFLPVTPSCTLNEHQNVAAKHFGARICQHGTKLLRKLVQEQISDVI
jgi:hypothetical protein